MIQFRLNRLFKRYLARITKLIKIFFYFVCIYILFILDIRSSFLEKRHHIMDKVSDVLECRYDHFIVYASNHVKLEDIEDLVVYNYHESLFNVSLTDIEKRLKYKAWVKDYIISKVFPNKIVLQISEKEAISVWRNQEKENLIDKYGDVFFVSGYDDVERKKLLHIAGQGANLKANKLHSELKQALFLRDKIYFCVYIGQRRWDIILNDGTLIKMPEENFIDALNRLESIIKQYYADLQYKNNTIDIIDLRNDQKTYIKIKK